MRVLPTIPGRLLFDFRVSLDDETYLLEFRWNERAASWTMGIFDVDRQPIRVGRRVLVGPELVGPIPDDRLPPGMMFAVDRTGTKERPGPNDLGDRVQIVYLSADEVGQRAQEAAGDD